MTSTNLEDQLTTLESQYDSDSDHGHGIPSETIAREIAVIPNLELSPPLQVWIEDYSRVGQRSIYLWKWCRRGVEVTTLSCASATLRDELADTKVLGIMLDVLLDDVADEQGESEFLDYLLELPFARDSIRPSMSSQQRAYADFTAAVWDEIRDRTRRFPRSEEFADVLQYDYRQLLNTMRYSHLLNSDPALLNLTEHDLYLPHNMHMMVSATMDLMCSPRFDHNEIGGLREAVWRAQYMGRVGNLVTTWEREIGERDFTSGVFASAASTGDLCPDDLSRGDQVRIADAIRSGDHEGVFHRRWRQCRRELLMMQPKLKSVDLGRLVSGLEQLICLHLGSRGSK